MPAIRSSVLIAANSLSDGTVPFVAILSEQTTAIVSSIEKLNDEIEKLGRRRRQKNNFYNFMSTFQKLHAAFCIR